MSSTRTATKPADDEPFDFNLNAVEAESGLRPFRFLWATKEDPNRRWTMAHIDGLDSWQAVAAADGGDVEAVLGTFELALGEEQWKEFRGNPIPQYKMLALFRAYQKHCGQKPGESPASSSS